MILHAAITLAERIQRELEPFCDRIEIAGSIRRARPDVNDIDLVVLPKAGAELALRERCKANAAVVTDGPKAMIVRLKNGVQLDVYFARPEAADLLSRTPTNFGTILLIRTGSKEHNIKLAKLARSQDKALKVGEGIFAGGYWVEPEGADPEYIGGQLIASETEEEIFEALGMKWISPAIREVNFNPGPSIPEILNRGGAEAVLADGHQTARETRALPETASQPASNP